MPSPPLNRPAPPESRISSKRRTRVGNSVSSTSIGARVVEQHAGAGHAVLAGSSPVRRTNDLILNEQGTVIAFAADHNAADASRTRGLSIRNEMAERLQQRFGYRRRRSHVGVGRRWKSRIENGTV